jgi:hypothetical protein
VATATTRPKKLRLPFTHFSIRKLAAYLQGRHGRHDPQQIPARQAHIRRERLRQILAGHDITFQRCACRKPRPGRSSGVFVFVEDAAKSVASSDAEPGDLVWISDRCG